MHPDEISSGRRREGTRPPLRPQGRYRVATATALRATLGTGDHYGPADADTTRADAYGAHPATPPTAARTARKQRTPEKFTSACSAALRAEESD